jgi:hypothetical protein
MHDWVQNPSGVWPHWYCAQCGAGVTSLGEANGRPDSELKVLTWASRGKQFTCGETIAAQIYDE